MSKYKEHKEHKASHQPATAIVIGARGGLGNAVLNALITREDIEQVIAITRNTDKLSKHPKVKWLKSDASVESIQRVSARLCYEPIELRGLFIATGTLHDRSSGRMPEKKVEELSCENMEEVFRVNTHLPMLWIQSLTPLLHKQSSARIVAFSARVGSIEDNKLGGWYSYRASKAALNMMLKTLAVEFRRRFPRTKIISFHPGTTDTSLSKPFQKGVPEHKLFTPSFVAERLLKIVDEVKSDGELSFLDWDNKPILW